MIYTDEQKLAESMAMMLNNAGDGLTVKSGTPLDTLVCSMDPLQQTDLVAATATAPFLERHTQNRTKIVDMAFDRLMANRNFARNTINPIIRDIAKECDEVRSTIEAQNNIFDMDIVVIEPLRIFSSSRLEEAYSPFKEALYLTFPENTAIYDMKADFTVDRFLKAVSSSNEMWNSAVSRMLLSIGKTPESFGNIIGDHSKPSEELQGKIGLLHYPSAVINFLYVEALTNGTYESEIDYDKAELARIKGWYGLQLSRQVDAIRDFSSARKLYLTGPNNNTIYVYKRRWDKIKGIVPPRTLIGVYIANSRNVITCNELVARNDDEVLAVVEGMADNIDSRERSNNFKTKVAECSSLKETIEFAIGRVIRDEEIVDVTNRDLLYSLSRNFFEHNVINTNTDILDYIRRAVCHVIGHESSALQLLSDIETYLDNNPEASLEKADIYASSRIVVQWLMNQAEVTKVAKTSQLLRNEI